MDRENITPDELAAFKKLAKDCAGATDAEIGALLKEKELTGKWYGRLPPSRAEHEISTVPVASGHRGTAGNRDRGYLCAGGMIGGGPSRADGIKVPKVEELKFFTGKPEGPP